jgi:hypothetical protein
MQHVQPKMFGEKGIIEVTNLILGVNNVLNAVAGP